MLNIIKDGSANLNSEGGKQMSSESLKKAVEDSGYKQNFIAEKVGVSEQTLSAILNGRQKIDVDTFFGIANVLRMTPNELYVYGEGGE